MNRVEREFMVKNAVLELSLAEKDFRLMGFNDGVRNGLLRVRKVKKNLKALLS